MYKKKKRHYPEIIDYFIEYSENTEYSSPKIIYEIYLLLGIQEKQISLFLILYKCEIQKIVNDKKTVEVLEEVLNKLHSTHNFLKKGKALHMLFVSKDLDILKEKKSN